MGVNDVPFTRAQAIDAGHSPAAIRRYLRNGEWATLRRGVYVSARVLANVAHDPQRRHAIFASGLIASLSYDAVAGGTSAARILGLDTIRRLPDELVIIASTVKARGESRDGYVVRHAELPGHHRTTWNGARVTTAARTVADLARIWPLCDAVAVADSALRLGRATMDDLRTVIADCSGWPGIDKARRAVCLADPRAESVLESVSRVSIHLEGLPAPRTQVVIGNARVDFLWEEFGVIGEADGLSKYEPAGRRSTRDIVRAEKHREERLTDAGYEIVRWGWEDARNPRRLAHRLRAAFSRGIERKRGRLA